MLGAGIPGLFRSVEDGSQGMSGWDFLQRKLADPLIADIPTIVLSGSDRPSGVMHHLAKPVDVQRLLSLVEQYC